MFKWDEFTQEFRNENDNIKPSEDFRNRLSAAVKEEAVSDINPYRRRYKVIGTVAAACAVLVIGISVYNVSGIFLSKSNNSATSDVGLEAGDKSNRVNENKNWSYHFKADNSEETTENIDEIEQALIGDSKIVVDGVPADEETRADIVEMLRTHKIIEESSDKEVESEIKIYSDETWIIEKYEDGDLYVRKEK